jgi:GNAT superfamily N-acetyltransferase
VIDRTTILAQYDREMREDPPASSGATFERTGDVVRERNGEDTIVYSRVTSASAPTVVLEEARRARWLGRALEWKVYAHDLPPELPALLEAAGFQPDVAETLAALDLRAPGEAAPVPQDLTVREVVDLPTFQDALRVSEAAFGPTGLETLEKFRNRLMDPTARLFVAYLGARPVAAGRLELPPGRAFAGLWGGGTVPDARHRGVYRALVHARAERARELGYRFVTVDAGETSRPILERLGFVPLTGIRGWLLSRTAPPR